MTQSTATSPTSNPPALELLKRLVSDIPDAGDINSLDWSDCAQTWRAYIPKELRAEWMDLPTEARLLGVFLANELLDRERFE